MNVVCFGQQNWDVCWVTKQQLMTRLARRGHRVLFVDPIQDVSHTSRQDKLRALRPVASGIGLREIEPGLHVWRHPYCHLLPGRLNARRQQRVLRGVCEKLGLFAPVSICLFPDKRWLQEGIRPIARIYFAEDEQTGFGGIGTNFARRQRQNEELLLRESELALAVSPTLLERFKQIQPRSYLQENAVELEDFSAHALARAMPHEQVVALPGPRVGFVGQVDERMDQDLVVALARRRRDVSWVLCGRIKDGVDVSRLAAEPNVTLTGYVPYEKLAGVYRELDVGLVPYVRSPLTESCNPLKVYEYLAAGLPVVSTPLAGLNACREVISLAEGIDAFAEAVDAALVDPEQGRPARLAVAKANTWDARTDLLEHRLHEAVELAQARRAANGGRDPDGRLPERPDRPGKQVVRLDPRLDGKDGSVRQMHDDFASAMRLGTGQRVVYAATRIAGRAFYLGRRGVRLLRGDTSAVRRICVVRNGQLGDTVVFLPTLAALRRAYPQARITVAVAPGCNARRLLETCRDIDEVIDVNFINASRSKRFRGYWDIFRRGYDLVLTGAWYFMLPELVFSGTPRRVGLYDGHPLQRFIDRAIPIDPMQHEAALNLKLVELLGPPVSPRDQIPRVVFDEPAARAGAVEMRRRLGLSEDEPIIAVHPGSKRPSRRWPTSHFAKLVTDLLRERPEVKVVFTGVPDELPTVEEIVNAVAPDVRSRALVGVGMTKLDGLIGFLDSCRALIVNDTGVMHLARARGVPLVAVLGPENDRRWGPHPFGTAPAVTVRTIVPCAPCGKWDCDSMLCLHATPPSAVLPHVMRVLDGQIEPRPDGLFGVERHETSRRWHELTEMKAQTGALPAVHVVLFVDPANAGLPSPTGRANEIDVAEALAAVARQDYPRLRVTLIADTPLKEWRTPGGSPDTCQVTPPSPDADATWASLLSGATQHVLPLSVSALARQSRGGDWPTGRISAMVSVMTRGPVAEATDGRRLRAGSEFIGTRGQASLLSAGCLFDSAVLTMLLDHPSGVLASPLPLALPVLGSAATSAAAPEPTSTNASSGASPITEMAVPARA